MDDYINLFVGVLDAIIIAGTILRVVLTLTKCQTEDIPLKDGVIKSKRIIKAGVIAMLLPSIIPIIRGNYVGSIDDQRPYIGVINLINAFIDVIILIQPFLISYKVVTELMLSKKGEDGNGAEHKRNAVKALVVGILIISSSVIIRTIFNYYV